MTLLRVHDLRTHFDTQLGVVKAVDGVSFEIDSGETLGLVGESGCGKSVTALSLMRLVPSPEGQVVGGEVWFEDRDILKSGDGEVRRLRGRAIAMVYQDPMTSLNPLKRIRRQVSEVLELHFDLDRIAAGKRAVELLEFVGIPNAKQRAEDYPHQFSGGMRQRVMIAMALACNPKLLIADEPTTALDVTIQAQILALLRKSASELGMASILITHDLGVVARATQRIHVMYAGRIVEKATTNELFANPKMPYTWGLLRSVPRLDEKRAERLAPIEGVPPDLVSPPKGCRFEPRCQYRRAICREREPELSDVPDSETGHEARCWGTQNIAGGGWLIHSDWRTDTGDEAVLVEIRAEAARTAGGVDSILEESSHPASPGEM